MCFFRSATHYYNVVRCARFIHAVERERERESLTARSMYSAEHTTTFSVASEVIA